MPMLLIYSCRLVFTGNRHAVWPPRSYMTFFHRGHKIHGEWFESESVRGLSGVCFCGSSAALPGTRYSCLKFFQNSVSKALYSEVASAASDKCVLIGTTFKITENILEKLTNNAAVVTQISKIASRLNGEQNLAPHLLTQELMNHFLVILA